MDDSISRQQAIDTVCGAGDYFDMIEGLNRLPSADVVEVVRCKDCKWFNLLGCAIDINDDSDKPTEDDYCSFGERRTDETDYRKE